VVGSGSKQTRESMAHGCAPLRGSRALLPPIVRWSFRRLDGDLFVIVVEVVLVEVLVGVKVLI
jgi:hypothetical protein